MLSAFANGGVYMYPVLLSGLVGLGICLVWLIKAARGRPSRLGAFAWAGIAGALALGLVGTTIGFQQTMGAVAAASPDQQGAIKAMGSTVSLYPLIFALGVAAVEIVLAALAGTLQANRRGRPA